MLSRLWVRHVRCWLAFSLAPALRSIASAAGPPVLFGDFIATMAGSDSHGRLPVKRCHFIFELQLAILASRFEPCSRPGGFPTSSNSHTVAVFCNGCTKIPISSGKGSGGRDPSSHRRLRPYLTSVRPAWIFQD